MALVPATKPEREPKSVRKAIQLLARKLGPNSTPTFAGLTVTGPITANEGHDVLRYALMMGLIHK